MTDDPLMTVKQVAEFFQVTEYTVREWLKDENNPLTGMKVGKSWRVRESSVHALANDKYGAS